MNPDQDKLQSLDEANTKWVNAWKKKVLSIPNNRRGKEQMGRVYNFFLWIDRKTWHADGYYHNEEFKAPTEYGLGDMLGLLIVGVTKRKTN